MAYIVSQMRLDNNTTYMTDIASINPDTIHPCSTIVPTPSPFVSVDERTEFDVYRDFAICSTVSGSEPGSVKANILFQKDKTYYIRFKIHKIPQYYYSGSVGQSNVDMYIGDSDNLSISLVLKDNNLNDWINQPSELIDSFSVPIAVGENADNQYNTYSFVFTPSKDFYYLIFKINRVKYDAIEKTELTNPIAEGDLGRAWLIDNRDIDYSPPSDLQESKYYDSNGNPISMKVTGPRIIWNDEMQEDGTRQSDFCKLETIVPNNQKWLKFGYQSRPGNLIVVNGEPITIGRSGIYEIDNGTKIESFMLAAPNKKIDAFLLDYAYLTDEN